MSSYTAEDLRRFAGGLRQNLAHPWRHALWFTSGMIVLSLVGWVLFLHTATWTQWLVLWVPSLIALGLVCGFATSRGPYRRYLERRMRRYERGEF